MKKLLTLLVAGALISGSLYAQDKKTQEAKEGDSKENSNESAPKGIKAILKPDAKVQKGLFDVYEQEGKVYYMIPKKLMGRDMLIVNRISKSAAGLRNGFSGYAGDKVQETMIRFIESPDGKNIFIQNVMSREEPREEGGEMFESVMRSNFQPLAADFKVAARTEDGDSILIDATSYINSDNELAAISPGNKRSLSLTNLIPTRSYITSVRSYPINVETKSVKTYTYAPRSTNPNFPIPTRPVTLEINSSMVLLPEVPMKPRYDDRRVGYFTDNYVDYEQNPQGVKNVSMISRFRLEPKDVDAYMRGELVEPIKPIVVYIDPTTPKKWVPYLIAGIDDWQEAFEAAGFKNAIYGREAPTKEEDPTWSIEDARYSAIVYKPSDIPNASGPHVSDPRSGETIEFHVNWYHNVQKLLRNWYMIQVGPNDERAQQMVLPEELMGRLIRFVSSHELGHSLGLRHNMGSTSVVPVDSLRSVSYLEKYGYASSIMDYSRYNYVAQPEDNIDPELLFPRINDYDLWAIEFGYRYLPQFETAEDEVPFLNEWIIEKNKNPRYWFGHESNPDDPRSQTEDIGDNQMKANALGIENLKRVINGLPEWTVQPNQNYSGYSEMYGEVLSQYMRYIGHVVKWVGGIYETPKTIEQGGDVYAYVEKEKQEEAMAWVKEYVINPPIWLYVPDVDNKTTTKTADSFPTVYSRLFSGLLNTRVLSNLIEAEIALGSSTYTTKDLFDDLNDFVWTNLKASDNYKRVMQLAYVNALANLYNVKANTRINPDLQAIVSYELDALKSKLESVRVSDPVISGHYKVLVERINASKVLPTKN